MLGLIEVKKEMVTKFNVARIWGSDRASWEFVGSVEASRGLLLIWDETIFKLHNCYKGDRWMCVEGVVVKNNFHCAICLVYGPHVRDDKISMWKELSYVVGLCQVPLCYLGDFNEILHLEERKGATSLSASAKDFRAWINDMELIDLALNDRKYTWFRGQSASRIDRSLVTIGWLDEYPEMRLRGGPRGFLRMVKKEWRGLGNIQFLDKMKALSAPLCRWHKQHFGNMNERIKRLEQEIQKVDDMVSIGHYDGTTEARRRALVKCCEKWYVRQELH
ncbi:uncharacterized protein LOC130945736 [Arachis stenosperma]|uniref:uncharacterized protein LOC130945736 n=1 Tax=Arachis stenosperma TaxID=217475 RepID=UPI0025AD1C5B|nr:uncharacterized protein LOC130945736 [Arachis stenosperma]